MLLLSGIIAVIGLPLCLADSVSLNKNVVTCGLQDRILNQSYLLLWCLSRHSVLHWPYKDQKHGLSLCCHCQRQTVCCRLLWNSAVESHIHISGAWQVSIPDNPWKDFSLYRLYAKCNLHDPFSLLFDRAGLQRAAVAVIGQEITHLQRWGQIQHHIKVQAGFNHKGFKN